MHSTKLNSCSTYGSVRYGCQAIILMRPPGNPFVPISRRPLLFRFAGSNAKTLLPVLGTERTVSHLGARLWILSPVNGRSFLFSRCSKCAACPRARRLWGCMNDQSTSLTRLRRASGVFLFIALSGFIPLLVRYGVISQWVLLLHIVVGVSAAIPL